MINERVIDLTMPITDGMVRYPSPNHPDIEVKPLGLIETTGRATSRIVLGSHSGTHVDAPCHFMPGSATVDRLDLAVLIGPAVVADVTASAHPGSMISRDALETAIGDRRPDRVILRTGWWRMWGTPAYFEQAPYLSGEAAELLLERGVKLLALDVPSPDAIPTEGSDSPNHKRLMGAGVILVEYLSNTSALTSGVVYLVVLPLAVVGADGAPARCVALEGSSLV